MIWPNDRDGDGLSNEEEQLRGTDPDHPDSDRDNMPDGLEVDFGFNPLDRTDGDPDVAWGTTDFDGDGIADNDADGDGAPNARELQWLIALNDPLTGTNIASELLMDPYDASDVLVDGDGDGILNGDEIFTRSLINRSSGNDYVEPLLDRDQDGLTLIWETTYGLHAKTNNSIGSLMDGSQDLDADGLTDLQEHAGVTHPWVSDEGHILRYRFDSKTTVEQNDAPEGGIGTDARLKGNATVSRVLDADWNRMQRKGNRKMYHYLENGMEVWPERQQALFLNGNGDYLALDATPLTSRSTDARTVMFFYRPARVANGAQVLYEEGNEVSGLSIVQNADALRAYAWNGATVREAQLPLPLLLGHWHHIAVTLNESALSLYYNGVLLAGDEGVVPAASGANATIGGSAQNELTRTAPGTLASAAWASGWFDDISIYNRVLSSSEFDLLKTAQISDRTLEEGLMANRIAGATHWLAYTFENQAADSAPNGGDLSGILQNGASTRFDATRNGQVLSTDGIDDYVAIPNIPFQSEEKASRAISLAFNAADTNADYQVIYHEGQKNCFTVYLYRDELWFIWARSTDNSVYGKIGNITPGTWHELLIDVNVPTGFLDEQEGRIHAYLDGQLGHAGPVDFTIPADVSRSVTLGGGPSTTRVHDPLGGPVIKINGRYFNGMIDELNLYRDLASQRPAPSAQNDYDGDGYDDSIDPDDDNDGALDIRDAFPLDPSEWLDSDSDGTGNNADPDDDNDGVLDADDDFPTDPSRWINFAPAFSVSEDSFSNMTKPTESYGAEATMSLKGTGKIPYLKFNVTDLTGVVTQALLHIHSSTETDVIEALAVPDNNWAEATLTWKNAPTPGLSIGQGQAASNSWFTVDVSGYVTAEGTYSIALQELGSSFGTISSKESGNAAYLEVRTYIIPTYTLTYTAGAQGSLSGETQQLVQEGSTGSAVTAIPVANYQFIEWSDGNTANPRIDANVTTDVSVSARFESIFPALDSPGNSTTTWGTASGLPQYALSNDDQYLTLTEALNGTPTSLLEHHWTFNVHGAELVTFYVEAHHSANSEGDDFTFAYSTNGIDWTEMLSITKTADDDTIQFFMLPSELSGTVDVRVMDADRRANNTELNSLYIDAIFIVSDLPSSAPTAAAAPEPVNGATGISLTPTLSWTSGMQTAAHAIYFGTSPTPGANEFQAHRAEANFAPAALAHGTTYYWAIDEENSLGTTPGPIWSFTTQPAPWNELLYDNFESGWGNWVDGGRDAKLVSNQAIGTSCLNIQAGSKSAASWLAENLNLSSYTELKIEFTYMPISFEAGEGFELQYSADGGSTWIRIKKFIKDIDFTNSTREYPQIIINSENYDLTSNANLKFRCRGNGYKDDAYIDEVRIYAR